MYLLSGGEVLLPPKEAVRSNGFETALFKCHGAAAEGFRGRGVRILASGSELCGAPDQTDAGRVISGAHLVRGAADTAAGGGSKTTSWKREIGGAERFGRSREAILTPSQKKTWKRGPHRAGRHTDPGVKLLPASGTSSGALGRRDFVRPEFIAMLNDAGGPCWSYESRAGLWTFEKKKMLCGDVGR